MKLYFVFLRNEVGASLFKAKKYFIAFYLAEDSKCDMLKNWEVTLVLLIEDLCSHQTCCPLSRCRVKSLAMGCLYLTTRCLFTWSRVLKLSLEKGSVSSCSLGLVL